MSTPGSPSNKGKAPSSNTGGSSTQSTLNAASKLVFTKGCEFIRNNDGKFSLAWENGSAISAVRGAAIDYIEPLYHITCTVEKNVTKYAPSADLDRLLKGGIKLPVALVIVGMRRIITSFREVEINIAEMHSVAADTCEEDLPEAEWNKVTQASQAFNQLIDMAPTILGLNGLSLMQKGHNYLDSDSMWTRLVDAGDLDTAWARFQFPDYAGIYFHDALHPFTAECKVSMASDVNSVIVKHSNGVLVKRMPGTPAGATLAFVTLAAIENLALARSQVATALGQIKAPLQTLVGEIRSRPLDFCSAFPRAHTRANLEKVAKVEPIAAFLYGACTIVFDRKSTILKSKAFRSSADKNVGMTSLGRGWGESLDAPSLDDASLKKLFGEFIAAIDPTFDPVQEGETEPEHEEEESEEEDEE